MGKSKIVRWGNQNYVTSKRTAIFTNSSFDPLKHNQSGPGDHLINLVSSLPHERELTTKSQFTHIPLSSSCIRNAARADISNSYRSPVVVEVENRLKPRAG